MVKRPQYSTEFKEEAVRLLDAGDRSAAEVAADLGVRRQQLYKWKTTFDRAGGLAKASKEPASKESEIARLHRELARVTEERDILKKAAAYFARELP
jgi:transposase